MGGILAGILKGPLSGVIGSIGEVIDKFVTTDKEKLEAKLALLQIEKDFQEKLLDIDTRWAEAQAGVIKSEAGSSSWLARSWRPILMLTFTFIIAWNYVLAPMFGVQTLQLPPDMWELLRLGIGGYVIGRSVEKVAPTLAQAMSKK